MIITQKKPLEELLAMLSSAEKIALVGCGQCATACETGGAPQLEELQAFLEENGKTVVGKIIPDESCQKLLIKKEVKALKDSGMEAIVALTCGAGAQTIADNVKVPVYPANNTMFLGQIERIGIFNEICHLCGDCVLGRTGGICPVTRCAKGLMNGPCGGARNGKCEANPENDCAWIAIYHRLEELGQLDKLSETYDDKTSDSLIIPRKVNLKEAKKK